MENKIKRHYNIDLVRGIVFLLMVLDHLIFDLAEIFGQIWGNHLNASHFLVKVVNVSNLYRLTTISNVIRFLFISLIFIFISGLSSVFSKSNLKRGLRLLIISLALTIVTVVFSFVMDDYRYIIYFGILHLLSIGMLLSSLFSKVNKYVLLAISLLIIILGIAFSKVELNTNWFIIFNLKSSSFSTADYYPIFPFLGFYILGYLFGDYYFIKRNNLKVSINYKNNLLTYFGRNTLPWYFIHQIILFIVLGIITLFVVFT